MKIKHYGNQLTIGNHVALPKNITGDHQESESYGFMGMTQYRIDTLKRMGWIGWTIRKEWAIENTSPYCCKVCWHFDLLLKYPMRFYLGMINQLNSLNVGQAINTCYETWHCRRRHSWITCTINTLLMLVHASWQHHIAY